MKTKTIYGLIALIGRDEPCPTAIASLSRATLTPEQQSDVQRFILPGFGADLCRCPQCSTRGPGGVWWFSQQMRDTCPQRLSVIGASNPAA
jgi:hypothetical protein